MAKVKAERICHRARMMTDSKKSVLYQDGNVIAQTKHGHILPVLCYPVVLRIKQAALDFGWRAQNKCV